MNKYFKNKLTKGFTLIELLVVISIIGVLMGLSLFGLQGAREASRDSRRKSDLELIRSGIEIYKSDCNVYPTGNGNPYTIFSGVLKGDGSIVSCPITNTYISAVPQDPTYPTSNYYYLSDGTTYELCTTLEQTPTTPATCSGSCGGSACNYKVVNP